MSQTLRFVDGRWRGDELPDPPDSSRVGTPPRRPGSVRRTSHLDVGWPEGLGGPFTVTGAARDLATSPPDGCAVLDAVHVSLGMDPRGTLTSVAAGPGATPAGDLVGASVMRGFRARCAEVLPPGILRSLLDDVTVISRIGSVAWFLPTLRVPLPEAYAPALGAEGESPHQRTPSGEVTCSGLRPGGFDELNRRHGIPFAHYTRPAGDLTTGDPWAWHEVPPEPAVRLRRRRRADVRLAGGRIEADLHHRDSVWGEDEVEYAIHEYTLQATVDAATDRLEAIDVHAHVLPFPECPLVTAHADALVGQDVTGFRSEVPRTLSGERSCTYLNDMLRGLADVPALAGALAAP